MKFFVPAAKDDVEAERVYEATKTFAATQTGFSVGPRRIFSISYHHEGTDFYAEVGQHHERIGEVVVAILDTNSGVYLVCSANRSVLRGEPMLVGKHGVKSATDFEA